MDEKLFPSVSFTVERIDGHGRRTGTADLYAWRGPGGTVIKLGATRAVLQAEQWNRLAALPAPSGGPEGLAQLQDAAARLVRTGMPERAGTGSVNTAAAARNLIADAWRQSRIAAGVCPECGSSHTEHERGLLFCGACGHTAQEAPDA